MSVSCALAAALVLAFPGERAVLPPISNCYVIGAVETNGGPATLDGETLAPSATGAFLAMKRVKPGANRFTLRQGTNELVRTFKVLAPKPASRSGKASAAPPRPPRNVYADLRLPANAAPRQHPFGKKPRDVLVVVDAGHGARDTGALTPHGWHESTFNLLQAQAVRDAVRAAGFRVLMTRDGDTFPALYDRPRLACRKQADAFVSIHHNATAADRDPRLVRHTVAYAWNAPGLALAAALQRRIAPVLAPVKDNGAVSNSFAVCRNPVVPSCLLEIDFVNLPEGEAAVCDETRRKRVAEAVAQGLRDWLETPPGGAKTNQIDRLPPTPPK